MKPESKIENVNFSMQGHLTENKPIEGSDDSAEMIEMKIYRKYYRFEKRKLVFAFLGFLGVMILINLCVFMFSFEDEVTKMEKQIEVLESAPIDHKWQEILQQENAKSIERYLSDELKEVLRASRYYDIHSFIHDEKYRDEPIVINRALPVSNKEKNFKRKILPITRSVQELELIINKMMYPPTRPQVMPKTNKSQLFVDLAFFADELQLNPGNPDYLQAQFYRYHKQYNIGNYGSQLPLCVIMAGKNDQKTLHHMYDSIRRQNYTNYRVVHVDDHSGIENVSQYLEYFKFKPDMKKKINIIVQRRQMNALYNRYIAVKDYCKSGDIVVDIDADDWLIGNQVFQLINTAYQAGNFYRGKRYQIWSAYCTHIVHPPRYFPLGNLVGQIPVSILQENSYRLYNKWRTTELRSYLRDLFLKIDKNDFVDSQAFRPGDFHVSGYDTFMQYSLTQMGGPKRIRIFDEFTYYYTGSPMIPYAEGQHSIYTARAQTPYQPLQKLSDPATRVPGYVFDHSKIDPENKKETVEQLTQKVREKRRDLKKQVIQLYERDKKAYFEKNKLKLDENVIPI